MNILMRDKKFFSLFLSILGLQAIKGHNIVNIYKMMFYPLNICRYTLNFSYAQVHEHVYLTSR